VSLKDEFAAKNVQRQSVFKGIHPTYAANVLTGLRRAGPEKTTSGANREQNS